MNTDLPLPPDDPMTKIGVLIATPVRYYNGIKSFHPKFQAMLARLTELSSDDTCPYEFILATMEGGLVRARNQMAHQFKQMAEEHPSLKWLITADDDLELEGSEDPAEPILRILAHKSPVVGALYTTKEEGGHWVATFMHNVELQKGCLLQVLECGTGLLCVHLQVFTEIDRMMPEFRYTDRDTGERMTPYYQHCMQFTDTHPDGDLLPEDYFFCLILRRLAIGIFVDTNLKLKHRDKNGVLHPEANWWPPIPGLTEVEV